MKTIKLLAVLFISTLVFTNCEDDHDDHDHGSDEELITTVLYTLTDGNNTIVLEWEDLDGDTGSAPTITSGTLTANTSYTGSIQLLNRTESPAEDITVEVRAEGDEHEFFYTNTAGLTITKTDTDGTNPVGIETTLSTGAAGSGSLTIVLKHEPTKPNDGTAANEGGSTDVQVTFLISIQ